MEPARYRRAVLRVFQAMAMASFFLSGALFALSRPVMLVVLGPRWEQAAIIFAAFSVGVSTAIPATVSTWLMASQGRGKDSLVSSCLISIVILSSFATALPFGAAGVAIFGSLAGVVVGLPILYYFAGRSGPVSTRDLWGGTFRYLPLGLAVYGSSCLAQLWFSR